MVSSSGVATTIFGYTTVNPKCRLRSRTARAFEWANWHTGAIKKPAMSFLTGERLAEARVPVREWDRDCRNNQTRVRPDEPATGLLSAVWIRARTEMGSPPPAGVAKSTRELRSVATSSAARTVRSQSATSSTVRLRIRCSDRRTPYRRDVHAAHMVAAVSGPRPARRWEPGRPPRSAG